MPRTFYERIFNSMSKLRSDGDTILLSPGFHKAGCACDIFGRFRPFACGNTASLIFIIYARGESEVLGVILVSVESTRSTMEAYLKNHDTNAVAPEAVFTVLALGQKAKGRKEINDLLDYFYHKAFDAHAKQTNLVVADGRAVLEAMFVGRHVGDFAGIKQTGKNVDVPMCISYDLKNDKIVTARIYFEMDVLRKQLSAT